jgi:hypothetical protein
MLYLYLAISLSPDSFINPHKSIFGTGNYDINVLMTACENKGFTVSAKYVYHLYMYVYYIYLICLYSVHLNIYIYYMQNVIYICIYIYIQAYNCMYVLTNIS